MLTLLWCTFLSFSISCCGRLFFKIYQCLCIINRYLLYKCWCHCLNFKDLRVHFIEYNHTLVLLVNYLVLESSLGSNIALQIPGSIHRKHTDLFKPAPSYLISFLFFTRNISILTPSPLSVFILIFSIFGVLLQLLDFLSFRRFSKILFFVCLRNMVYFLTAARSIFFIFGIYFFGKFTCF